MCASEGSNELKFYMYKKEDFESYLCQGDIIINYPKDKLQSFYPEEFYKGIILLSYTCDLKNGKLDHINYCPIYDIENLIIDFYDTLKNEGKFKSEIRKRNKEQKNPYEYIRGKVLTVLHRIFNYEDQGIFYLEADEIFNGNQCYANLEQIYTISLNPIDKKNENNEVNEINPIDKKNENNEVNEINPIDKRKEILDSIINCRKASLTNPFIEKLGYMVGNCFNRVAMEVFDKSTRDKIYDTKYKSRFEGLVNLVLDRD